MTKETVKTLAAKLETMNHNLETACRMLVEHITTTKARLEAMDRKLNIYLEGVKDDQADKS